MTSKVSERLSKDHFRHLLVNKIVHRLRKEDTYTFGPRPSETIPLELEAIPIRTEIGTAKNLG